MLAAPFGNPFAPLVVGNQGARDDEDDHNDKGGFHGWFFAFDAGI
jgi:hypothetical protein